MTHARATLVSLLLAISAMPATGQNCGWSRIDHRVAYDASGVWNPNVYRGVVVALTAGEIGGAVSEGAESRFGKAMWKGIDAEIIGGLGAEAGKYIFTRVRPSIENNALVTPYIMEYASEYPATWTLLLLPVYVGAGRIKNQAHWQTRCHRRLGGGWIVGLVCAQSRRSDY